jgi:tight adherence protein B
VNEALWSAVAVLVGAALVRGFDRGVAWLVGTRRWRLSPPACVRSALADTGWDVDPLLAWTTAVVGVAAATVFAFLVAGAGLAFVVPVTLTGAAALSLAFLRGRAARLVDAALPDAVDALARALRSGATLGQALQEVAADTGGPLGHDLRSVVAEVDAGRPLVVAVDGWAERASTASVRLAAASLALSAETGGAAARALDGLAATLRANGAVAGELRAQSSQARLSGVVIALAPLAFGALAVTTDPRTASFLFRTPIGLSCLVAGLALDGVAAWWMHRITGSVT